MLRENEQPDPSEQMLKLGQKAFGIYVTFELEFAEDRTNLLCRHDPGSDSTSRSA